MLSLFLVEDAKIKSTTLVVIAGGKASRMQSLKTGGKKETQTQNTKVIDKALLRLEGKSLVERTLEQLKDQPFLARAINSNAERETFRSIAQSITQDFQVEIFPDSEQHKNLGPLAGILAAMRWSEKKNATWMLTVPCDCPFLPKDLWQQLQQRQKTTGADIVCGLSHGRRHPVVALWKTALRSSLETALAEGVRKIDRWTEQHHTESQAWQQTPDPFFNINRPEDLRQAEDIARAIKSDSLDEKNTTC